MIRDRTVDGLARARAEGKRLGRPCKRVDMERVRELRAQGLGYRRIADALGVSRPTLWARLKKEGVNGERESPSD
jgi:putative DNA-invertase from lambdoid prophage Rac